KCLAAKQENILHAISKCHDFGHYQNHFMRCKYLGQLIEQARSVGSRYRQTPADAVVFRYEVCMRHNGKYSCLSGFSSFAARETMIVIRLSNTQQVLCESMLDQRSM